MPQTIGVDGGAGGQALPALVVAEPSASFLDEDGRRSMIPNAAAKPDTDVRLALSYPILVAPRAVRRVAARQPSYGPPLICRQVAE